MLSNEICNIYNKRYHAPFSGKSCQVAIDNDVFVITDLISTSIPRDICDLCCGLGFHMIKLAEIPQYTVIGVDNSSVAFEKYMDRYRHLQNPTYVCMSAIDFAKDNVERYDLVLCNLPHFDSAFNDEAKSLLASIWRICKKGGVAIFSFLCAEYASHMTGKYKVRYDRRSPTYIFSEITYSSTNNLLCIKQNSGAWKGDIIEKMHLYTIPGTQGMLIEAGFVNVTSLADNHKYKRVYEFQRTNECKSTMICRK